MYFLVHILMFWCFNWSFTTEENEFIMNDNNNMIQNMACPSPWVQSQPRLTKGGHEVSSNKKRREVYHYLVVVIILIKVQWFQDVFLCACNKDGIPIFIFHSNVSVLFIFNCYVNVMPISYNIISLRFYFYSKVILTLLSCLSHLLFHATLVLTHLRYCGIRWQHLI